MIEESELGSVKRRTEVFRGEGNEVLLYPALGSKSKLW